MDNAEIYEYINNLDSAAPQYLQDYAISMLVNLEESKLPLLLQTMSKSYWRNAAIVLKKIGYPRVKSVIPELLEWIRDMNWPGAEEIAELLATVDEEIIPYVKQVLRSGEGIWIIWVLSEVVSKWDNDLISLIKENLWELASTLDSNLLIEGVDVQALKLLRESKFIDKEKALAIINRKSNLYEELLENLQECRESIDKVENL
jgi:hypothetical protein